MNVQFYIVESASRGVLMKWFELEEIAKCSYTASRPEGVHLTECAAFRICTMMNDKLLRGRPFYVLKINPKYKHISEYIQKWDVQKHAWTKAP